MKTKRKSKSHAKRHNGSERVKIHGMKQIYKRRGAEGEETETYTPMETGQPNHDLVPDIDNPAGVQGGRGPLNQEGEGDRQNDQLAELEEIKPDLWEKP